MKFQLICRGSLKLGLGHLLRSRTFARQVAPRHELEVIAIVEPGLEKVLADLSCPIRFVQTDAEAIPLVREFGAQVVVFDSTFVQPELFAAALEASTLRVSISPVFDHAHRVDLLFSRTKRNPVLPGVKILGGLQYSIFNDGCTPVEDAAYARSLAIPELPIAVCMGGADAANKTLRVLRAISTLEGKTTLWVLLGEGYHHSFEELVHTVQGDRRHEVILAKTNRSMWRVMSNCALAVLAGGLTSVEAVFAGLPTVNLFDSPSHQALLSELLAQGCGLDGGLFSDQSLLAMTRHLRRLERNRGELLEMRRQTRGLVDNRGPERVLQEIEEHLSQAETANPAFPLLQRLAA